MNYYQYPYYYPYQSYWYNNQGQCYSFEHDQQDIATQPLPQIDPDHDNQEWKKPVLPVPAIKTIHDPFQQIMKTIQEFQNKIDEIEEENNKLKEKLDNLQPINIENINYKIQELTVKELSGTLNIGMTALTDPENLKKLMDENGDIQFNDIDTSEFEELVAEDIEEDFS